MNLKRLEHGWKTMESIFWMIYCNEIEKKIMRNEISSDELLGVGIGVPGPVIDGRRVLRCVNLGWGENVASYIENRLEC